MADNKNDVDLKTMQDVGAITYSALKYLSENVKPGAKLIDITKLGEDYLKENNYEIAFPLNISINNYAAHYSPKLGEETSFNENDIVKLDFGAEKNGFFGDCAITIDLSRNNQKFIDATDKAIANALSIIKHGTKVRDIGKEIAKTIELAGLKPIKNLGGHGILINNLHTDPFIPNYDNGDETELEEGMVIALEPFATNGKGLVTDSDFFEICSFNEYVNVRSESARKLLDAIKNRFEKRAFSIRWLADIVSSRFSLYSAINELIKAGAVSPIPALLEIGNGIVSQTEVELIVEKDSCNIITK